MFLTLKSVVITFPEPFPSYPRISLSAFQVDVL